MRVLLVADMEGVSRIVDHRECWVAFPEYWATGRARMTADVVAAAQGLLDGGANRVVVASSHGIGGWPNLLTGQFPDGCELLEDPGGPGDIDAQFHVGYHARCGTMDGFVSHTFVPDLRMKVEGRLITENHHNAWTYAVPLLGVTGDTALGPQLDGALAGTPFLAVKRSASRTATHPVAPTPERSAGDIRAFARSCISNWRARHEPSLPETFTVSFSMPPDLAGILPVADHGLERVGPSVLRIEARSWGDEVRPAWLAVIGAAIAPLLAAQGALDLSSEDAMRAQSPADLNRYRRYFDDWLSSSQVEWQE